MRRTKSYWRFDWWNAGRLCHTSYCIWLIHFEPGFPGIRWESVCDRHVDGLDSALKGYIDRQGKLPIRHVCKVCTRVSSYLSELKLPVCARRYLRKSFAYIIWSWVPPEARWVTHSPTPFFCLRRKWQLSTDLTNIYVLESISNRI